jgi:uncharacterized phage protein gp47/JayE
MPRFSEILDDAVAGARAWAPDLRWSEGALEYRLLQIGALLSWQYHQRLGQVQRDLLPDTAAIAGVVRWGNILGVPRKGATPARKAGALRITGVAGATVAINTVLTHQVSGIKYRVTTAVLLPASGEFDGDVEALTGGLETRRSAGDILTFDATPLNINDTAELQLDMDEGGLDEEPVEVYRTRVLAQFQATAALITNGDWKGALERLSTVDAGFVYPLRAGLGSVDVVALKAGTGGVRVLSEAERQDVEAAMEAIRFIATKMFRVLKVETTTVDIEVTVEARPGESWDWGDATPLTVALWTPATFELKFTTDRPSGMAVGDRLVIDDLPTLGTGAPFEIVALVSTDTVVLGAVPSPAPLPGDSVYSAGSLTDPVRDTLLAYTSTLGPARGQYAADVWDADIDPDRLRAAVFQAVPGVGGMTVIAPAAPVLAGDPAPGKSDDFIELLVPGRVLVRREN